MGSFSIWHWIILLLFALAIYGVIRIARSKTNRTPTWSGAPVGVGGWLALLVAGLTVLGPLMGAGRMNADFLDAERQYPNLANLAAWGNYKTATWLTYIGNALLSIYAGYRLAKGRDWSVVRFAQITLWIIGPTQAIFVSIVLAAIFFGKPDFSPEFVGGFVASALTATLWTMYLAKSKRVRATYLKGEQLQEARDSYAASPPAAAAELSVAKPPDNSVLIGQLTELRKLYDEKLISHEVYIERQRQLIAAKPSI